MIETNYRFSGTRGVHTINLDVVAIKEIGNEELGRRSDSLIELRCDEYINVLVAYCSFHIVFFDVLVQLPRSKVNIGFPCLDLYMPSLGLHLANQLVYVETQTARYLSTQHMRIIHTSCHLFPNHKL